MLKMLNIRINLLIILHISTRWEILTIHTKNMKEHGYLAEDVDLRHLAMVTSQYSGAEIAGLIRLAASYALDRKVSMPYFIDQLSIK